MEKKLIKLAVAALTTVTVLPAGAQAEVAQSAGTFLAAGCGGHGCAGSKPVSYNYNSNSQQTDAYNYDSRNQPSRSAGYDVNTTDYRSTDTYNTNRGYTSTTPSYSTSTTTYGSDVDTSRNSSWNTTTNLTEADLLKQLSPQGRAIYQSLDSEGKSIALRLASQESYRDKDLAVKEAQRRINENRGTMSGTSSYQNQNNGFRNR